MNVSNRQGNANPNREKLALLHIPVMLAPIKKAGRGEGRRPCGTPEIHSCGNSQVPHAKKCTLEAHIAKAHAVAKTRHISYLILMPTLFLETGQQRRNALLREQTTSMPHALGKAEPCSRSHLRGLTESEYLTPRPPQATLGPAALRAPGPWDDPRTGLAGSSAT